MSDYEVLLGSAAVDQLRELPQKVRIGLFEALQRDLSISRDVITIEGTGYVARRLGDYVVVYRPLTHEELASQGKTSAYLVASILPNKDLATALLRATDN